MTMQALPKVQELTDKINQLAHKKRKPTDFEIRLLKKEVDKLKNNINPEDYYDYLGQVAYLENDRVNLVKYYEKAIKLSPNNYNVYSNYVSALKNSGLNYYKKSKALYEQCSNTHSLKLFFEACLYNCRFQEAIRISNHNDPKLVSGASIFENAKLSDDEAQQLCELAYSVLETKNLYFSGSEIEVIDDCIHYSIYVDEPIAKIPAIDFELSRTFAKNLDDMRDDVIVFEYRSVETLKS